MQPVLLQSPTGSSARRSIPLRHEGSAALCRLAATSSGVAAFLFGESFTVQGRSGAGSPTSVERSADVAEAPLRRDQAAFDLVKAGDDRVIGIVLAALGDTGDPQGKVGDHGGDRGQFGDVGIHGCIMPGNSQGPHSPGDSVTACFDASTSEVSPVT